MIGCLCSTELAGFTLCRSGKLYPFHFHPQDLETGTESVIVNIPCKEKKKEVPTELNIICLTVFIILIV